MTFRPDFTWERRPWTQGIFNQRGIQFQMLKQRKPDWVAARLQLAEALERQGLASETEHELVALHGEQPHVAMVTRRLVSFYERHGRAELARRVNAQEQPPAPPKRALSKSKH